jgi:hypothetical protein
LCEFTPHLQGNSALADLRDGAVDRPELQRIASRVPQGATLGEAFARLFPEGLPPLVKGQPLRTRTDAHGAYFLPVPSAHPRLCLLRCPRPSGAGLVCAGTAARGNPDRPTCVAPQRVLRRLAPAFSPRSGSAEP